MSLEFAVFRQARVFLLCIVFALEGQSLSYRLLGVPHWRSRYCHARFEYRRLGIGIHGITTDWHTTVRASLSILELKNDTAVIMDPTLSSKIGNLATLSFKPVLLTRALPNNGCRAQELSSGLREPN